MSLCGISVIVLLCMQLRSYRVIRSLIYCVFTYVLILLEIGHVEKN